ncbi:unnamed protein product, partial [Prorocentrum cordatum]
MAAQGNGVPDAAGAHLDGGAGAACRDGRCALLERLQREWEQLARVPQAMAARAREVAAGPASHPERDVRLWAARCLAEVLRIFAPEPPLGPAALRGALELFVDQLALLEEPLDTPLHVHAVGLLERLAELRALVLLFDCESPEALLDALVAAALRAATGAGARHLSAALSELVAAPLREADELPRGCQALLIEALAPAGGPGARDCARDVARRVLGSLGSTAVAAQVNAYLIDELHGPAQAPADAGSLLGSACELFVIEPAFVVRLLPHLQEDLQCADGARRRAATQAAGRMLSSAAVVEGPAGQRSPLLEAYPLLLDRYLERYVDVDDGVRAAALEGAGAILAAAAASGQSCEGADGQWGVALASAAAKVRDELIGRCLDPCLAVRLRVVELAAEAAGLPGGLELMGPAAPAIFRRVFDKKPLVREACIEAVGELYMERGLPAWVRGRPSEAARVLWAPQLLCEAFLALAGGRLGQTAQLEECLERCVLGCAGGLDAHGRAQAILGLCAAAAGSEDAARGLELLLARKRQARVRLQQFVALRVQKGAPLLSQPALPPAPLLLALPSPPGPSEARPGSPLVTVATIGSQLALSDGAAAEDAENPSPAHPASEAAAALARLAPAAEARGAARGEAVEAQLRALDAVRDRALWAQLDLLLKGSDAGGQPIITSELPQLLNELGRLLRVHGLTELEPLLRRGLAATWLLPDQVHALMDSWRLEGGAPRAVQWAVAHLPKHFPAEFAPHVDALVARLAVGSTDDSRAAVKGLAALGRLRRSTDGDASSAGVAICGSRLADALLATAAFSDAALAASEPVHREAVEALGLAERGSEPAALQKIFQWAQHRLADETCPTAIACGLHAAAACLESSAAAAAAEGAVWRERAEAVLKRGPQREGCELACAAAASVLAVLGAGGPLAGLLAGDGGHAQAVQAQAGRAALGAVGRGLLELSTELLTGLASLACGAARAGGRDAAALLASLQLALGSPSSRARLPSRIRLSVTLPAMLALAEGKTGEGALQTLQAAVASILRQCASRGEPLLDFAIAYFVHFLSRLPAFVSESEAPASAFPESSRVAGLFVQAATRGGAGLGVDVAAAALQALDSFHCLADRERPASDAVHRAAAVLRH